MAFGRTALFAGLAFLPLAVPAGGRAGEDTRLVEFGRQLFEENWLRPPADDSPLALARKGDGFGPLFNGASCAECHRLGGVGGAGPRENDVEIVSLALPLDAGPEVVRRAVQTAKRTHPGFLRDTNVFLHRFGLDREGGFGTYNAFRTTIRSAFPEEILPAAQTQVRLPDGLPYQLARRNTTALWGAGLIEDIPPRLVALVAERQGQQFPDMAGTAVDGGEGRFGWRGQTATVSDFVRNACAEELGLRVKGRGDAFHDQPPWPVEGEVRIARPQPPVDLTPNQVDALVAFVRSLPAPRQVVPADPHEAAGVEAGRTLFGSIGCVVCHVPDMGAVTGIYSDLLLHDMGPTFADRVAAPLAEAKPRVVTQTGIAPVRGPGRGYSGSSLAFVPTSTTVVIPPSLGDLAKATQAFRTPPLWGVADSAPYLHDGRAATLDEAIRLHAGQADPAAERYAELSGEDRGKILAFLGTLRAPQVE